MGGGKWGHSCGLPKARDPLVECRAGKLGTARDAGNWPKPTQTHSSHGRNNHSVCVGGGWVGTCWVGDWGEEPGSRMGYVGGR